MLISLQVHSGVFMLVGLVFCPPVYRYCEGHGSRGVCHAGFGSLALVAIQWVCQSARSEDVSLPVWCMQLARAVTTGDIAHVLIQQVGLTAVCILKSVTDMHAHTERPPCCKTTLADADHTMDERSEGSAGDVAKVAAARLARLFFAVGQFAIQHLVRAFNSCVTDHSVLHTSAGGLLAHTVELLSQTECCCQSRMLHLH